MSSKKALRKKAREKKKEERRSGLSPVTLFILGVGVAVILAVVAGLVLGVDPGSGDPPRPGAVWSDAHGHWH